MTRRRTVDALLEAVARLGEPDLWRLVAFAPDATSRELRAARSRVRHAIRTSGRQREVDEVRDALGRWTTPRERPFWMFEGIPMTTEIGARQAAAPVLLDVAAALVVRDLLGEETFETLYRPWRELTGEE